jgi:hypothetical protein
MTRYHEVLSATAPCAHEESMPRTISVREGSGYRRSGSQFRVSPFKKRVRLRPCLVFYPLCEPSELPCSAPYRRNLRSGSGDRDGTDEQDNSANDCDGLTGGSWSCPIGCFWQRGHRNPASPALWTECFLESAAHWCR